MASRPPYTTDHTATFLQALSSVWLIIPNRLTQRNTFLWSLWLTLLSVPVICWQTRMWADEGKWRGSRVLPLSAKEGSAAATTAADKQWRDDRAPVCVTVSPVWSYGNPRTPTCESQRPRLSHTAKLKYMKAQGPCIHGRKMVSVVTVTGTTAHFPHSFLSFTYWAAFLRM